MVPGLRTAALLLSECKGPCCILSAASAEGDEEAVALVSEPAASLWRWPRLPAVVYAGTQTLLAPVLGSLAEPASVSHEVCTVRKVSVKYPDPGS